MGRLRIFPGRHNGKSDFHSYAETLADPEVKAKSRNIACPSEDWLELLEVRLDPDFNLKGQSVATTCPTFFHFNRPNMLWPLLHQLRIFFILKLSDPDGNLRRQPDSPGTRAEETISPHVPR